MEEVKIQKLVHGGQGLGELSDGRKVFVWNALPGEVVRTRIIKKKRSYVEAIADDIVHPADDRVEPIDDNYLATSPWQIMNFTAENNYKKQIVEEIFAREHVDLPKLNDVVTDNLELNYRNKMEYSFWGDDDGLHLALYRRGSHGKQIVTGSSLAIPALDAAANNILKELNTLNIRAGDLKSLIIRVQQDGQAVGCLFVKPTSFPKISLPSQIKGIKIYHSNPKSPASVATSLLHEIGDTTMSDILNEQTVSYAVEGFFQVNIPVFENTIKRIKEFVGNDPVVDMYGGVGSIGIALQSPKSTVIELDAVCVDMAKRNALVNSSELRVIQASSETALEYIKSNTTVIVDPPRAGLHKKVVDKITTDGPQKLVYLSCNPATQARDLKYLEDKYKIEEFEIYNFFPRTPHIETLAFLVRNN